MTPDLSIVILSYNTKDLLHECLSAVYDRISKQVLFEVIVVDNASSDDSVTMVKKNFPQVILIENKDNLGFSKGNNVGIKHAKGKYVLFLNSDAIVYKDTVETMLAFMGSHRDAGAATCMVAMPNGEIDDASHRGFPTPWNAFCHFSGLGKVFPKSMVFNGYHLGYKDIDKIHEIDALAGAFMLVRREAGEQVGWWDEDYFFYGEDLDFCYKLKQKKWKIYFVPSAKVLHYKGVSGGIKKESQHVTKASKETKIRATNARFDAMKIFYKKHYTKKYHPLLTWAVMQAVDLKKQLTLRKI
jgi:GT2 family glycosyltransferase